MKRKYEIIVLGGGIGGLVSGAFLAKQGKDVLIIDKNSFPGGYMSSIKQNGFIFDRGIIFLSGIRNEGEFYKILKELEIDSKIELLCLDVFGKIRGSSYEVNFLANRKKMAEELGGIFPDESAGISDFLLDCENLLGEIVDMPSQSMILPQKYPTFFKYRNKTLEEAVTGHFKNQKLRNFFLAHPFFLSEPKDSVLVSALRMASALAGDLYYPKGGMQVLTELFVESIHAFNGEVVLNSEVQSVLIEDNKVKGVCVNGDQIQAEYLISDIDPWYLFNNLISDENKNIRYMETLNRSSVGKSAFMVYLGAELKEKPECSYLSFLPVDDYVGDFNPGNCGIAILIPSSIDSSLAPPGKHSIIIEVPAPYDYKKKWMTEISNQEHELMIEEASTSIIKSAEKVIPGLSKNIVCKDCASPVSFEKLTNNRQGSTMGWAKTPSNMQKIKGSRLPVQGLFQTGQWAGPFGGVLGSSLYGKEIARTICQSTSR